MVGLENVVAGRVLPVVLSRGPPGRGLLLLPRPLFLLFVLDFLESVIFFMVRKFRCPNVQYLKIDLSQSDNYFRGSTGLRVGL